MRKIAIFGCGGMGRELAQWASDSAQNEIVFVVHDGYFNEHQVDGIPVFALSEFSRDDYEWLVAVGKPDLRKRIVEKIRDKVQFATFIHPTARVGRTSTIEAGVIIGPGVGISVNVHVGSHTIISAKSTIGHDTQIGDFVTISPHVAIMGNCKVGKESFLGTSSCFKEGTTIAKESVIGMGSVVISNLDTGVYVGNPARQIK